jgi:N-glycosylase/DNA lyase
MMPQLVIRLFPAHDYDLAATLRSGQAFRWKCAENGWTGVISGRWVRLRSTGTSVEAEALAPADDWTWLTHYLQTDVALEEVLRGFPGDEPMQSAVAACRGLRLLRQDPWECLASFILSSTKQILQIQQIVANLCECYGQPVVVPAGEPAAWAFPSPARLASVTETELRACKMGFRAPYLLEAARRTAAGELDLTELGKAPLDVARGRLMELPGVGRKIADCVLLFAYGFQSAFPVDVWVLKALRQLYFPRRRRVTPRQIQQFVDEHFGPYAGYAQQYLFHYMRVARPRMD